MFIKEVNITGFRSYRELTTISNLSNKHNVIVGRNGSGKSNFFYAIQFLLSDEYYQLNQKQRYNILHEGTGDQSNLAKIEVVFDNSDRRISIENSEVRIMRQVGHKKDQYFIDNKVSTRTDILNLMEAAGFSRSNPYYIVKQGKITELTTATDTQRLQLIREVAGTRIFDQKKEESLKILQETQIKISKSVTLINFIEDRLIKLEEEKNELKEYQKWDKIKRAVEYTIYEREINEARKKINLLVTQRNECNLERKLIETTVTQIINEIQNFENHLRKLENENKEKKNEKISLMEEKAKVLNKKNELELSKKDLEDVIKQEQLEKEQAKKSFNSIEKEIAEKEAKLAHILPEYNKIIQEESNLSTNIRIAEQECHELNAKQSFKEKFKTKTERDEHLKKEIKFLEDQLTENKKQIQDVEKSLLKDEESIKNLQNSIVKLNRKLQKVLKELDSINEQSNKKKKELDEFVALQIENSRVEKKNRNLKLNFQSEIQQVKTNLTQITSKAIFNGIESVKTVLKFFEKENDSENKKIIDGYYGCVIDLFECDEKYNKAIEITAENRLFYHVVESDEIAAKLLEKINEQDLPGQINFYPLNKIILKPKRTINDSQARLVLNELHYDEKFETVFRLIFGNTVFVHNLKEGSRIAQNERFNCVTLEGDQISRRGPITGGYISLKTSKLDLAKTIRKFNAEQNQIDKKIETICQKATHYVNKVEQIQLSLNKIEIDKVTLCKQYKDLSEQNRSCSEQLNNLQKNKESTEILLFQLKNRTREIEARKQTLINDIGTSLNSQLSENENNRIIELQDEVKKQKILLAEVLKQKKEIENNKLKLEVELQSNLYKKKNELNAKIQNIQIEEKFRNLTAEQTALETIDNLINKITKTLTELEENLFVYENEKENCILQLEDKQRKKQKIDEDLKNFKTKNEIYATKILVLQKKVEEISRQINEIGSLPLDELEKFKDYNFKKLGEKLTECIKELKKYENVNKNALDQFIRTSSQKDNLSNGIEELKKNEKSIKELLEVLENRRYETLQLTFKQVAKNFHDVFCKLISNGRADLVMKTSDFARDSLTGEPIEHHHILEKFVGIGIQVSFNNATETKEMSHLSGGQKTLVAIALIFAIQKCDLAPFYLFDEIDAALDPEHRKSVADMINELSETAQFITTTFRKELLEHADKYYGVKFRNKVSYINEVTREQAYDFIQDDQTHS